jgi:hypothetical protein
MLVSWLREADTVERTSESAREVNKKTVEGRRRSKGKELGNYSPQL